MCLWLQGWLWYDIKASFDCISCISMRGGQAQCILWNYFVTDQTACQEQAFPGISGIAFAATDYRSLCLGAWNPAPVKGIEIVAPFRWHLSQAPHWKKKPIDDTPLLYDLCGFTCASRVVGGRSENSDFKLERFSSEMKITFLQTFCIEIKDVELCRAAWLQRGSECLSWNRRHGDIKWYRYFCKPLRLPSYFGQWI